MHSLCATRLIRFTLTLLLAASAGACSMDKTTAPTLAGPSEFGLSVNLSAVPDRLTQDGESQSAITATLRGPNGEPRPGVPVQFRVAANDGSYLTLTETVKTTNGEGHATIGVVAPPAPQFQPKTPVNVTIYAVPIGSNLANAVERSVVLRLEPPAGTPPPNDPPQAEFNISPSAPVQGQSVRFDASASKDEGVECQLTCTYAWDFGDGGTGQGMLTTHVYESPGVFAVTLKITDARGSSATRTRGVVVEPPAVPVANIVFSPTAPDTTVSVNFDGAGSTVGSPATIVEYSWSFGDGTDAVTASSPTASHQYSVAGSYIVRLTVKDSLGRTATVTAGVTVKAP